VRQQFDRQKRGQSGRKKTQVRPFHRVGDEQLVRDRERRPQAQADAEGGVPQPPALRLALE